MTFWAKGLQETHMDTLKSKTSKLRTFTLRVGFFTFWTILAHSVAHLSLDEGTSKACLPPLNSRDSQSFFATTYKFSFRCLRKRLKVAYSQKVLSIWMQSPKEKC